VLEPVVFQAPYPPYNAGETAGVPVAVAERLLAKGLAVRPGEEAKVLIPQPRQGSVPQAVRCGACGESFMPGDGHRCATVPMSAAVFEAGFTQGQSRRRGRRGR
jgi:hypothetical protein